MLWCSGNSSDVVGDGVKPSSSAGIAARFVEQVVLCIAWSRAVVIIAVCFGAIATLMMPVSIALLSKNVAIYEQVILSYHLFSTSHVRCC